MNTYIVILTWNNYEDFGPCIMSLALHTRHPATVIVVDNGSTAPELNCIHSELARCVASEATGLDHRTSVLLSNHENTGLPAAQNQALDWIADGEDGPYAVVLLDADTKVSPGWLTKLAAYSEDHPDIGLLSGGKSPGGPPCPVYHKPSGHWYTRADQYGHPSGYMEGESVDFACVYVRPELLARGLRFDLGYHLYDGHDQDMSFRVRSWGYRCWAIDAGVEHYGQAVMKRRGWQWDGGGRNEWADLRASNIGRFVSIWGDWLAAPRATLKDEMWHMETMNASLVADAGKRKDVPK